MEDRQRQIREGAGLEESRLNTEFIEFLRRYGFWLSLVILVGAGGYALYTRWSHAQRISLDQAFNELDAAAQSRNPASLEQIADEEDGRGAVPELARLAAADLRLTAYRSGIPAGTSLDPQGNLPEGVTYLTDEQRQQELAKARELYQRVFDETKDDAGAVLHAVNALTGLAAVAESKGELAEAKGHYQAVIDRATVAGFTELTSWAQKRIASLDTLATSPRLYAQAELPQAAIENMPFSTGLQNIKMRGPDGQEIPMGSDGTLVPIDGPPPGLEPVPAPEGVPPVPAPATPPATPEPAPQP